MKNTIDSILRYFGYFDSNGLRYSRKHLDKMKYRIAYFSIKEQAEYADIVTTRNVNDPQFLLNQFPNHPKTELILKRMMNDKTNATSIGNTAYIVLYCHDARCKEIAHNMLDEYFNYIVKTKKHRTESQFRSF